MIQALMLIALGFLCASLIGLFLAPPLWRYAVRVTTKRIQSRSPLTMAEIQADRDQLRAEYALSVRKLELTVEELKERAARQLVELSRAEVRIDDLLEKSKDQATQIAERDAKIVRLTTRSVPLEEDLRIAGELAAQQAEKIRQQGEVIERQSRSLAENGKIATGKDSEIATLRKKSEQQAAEERTLEMAHHAMAERVNQLGRLAATIESRRAELYEARRQVTTLRQELAAGKSTDPEHQRLLRRGIVKLAAARDELLADLREADGESRRLREEIDALDTTWQMRANPYSSLRNEVDSVGIDMNRIAEKLHGEIAEAELLTEAALEPTGTGAPAATAEADTAAADDIDGQLPSLADRIRALQTELARS
jgi:chromosome segregation ATPase